MPRWLGPGLEHPVKGCFCTLWDSHPIQHSRQRSYLIIIYILHTLYLTHRLSLDISDLDFDNQQIRLCVW